MAQSDRYEARWESLIEYGVPNWMRDEKFGLYAHWGLYSIPGFGMEWYGKRMYEPGHPIHEQHVETYGSPARFGYKDFIPQFTAEHYDPAAWAELFEYSGAGYAGFSLAHHDGFGLWDSDVYEWNVGKKGPKRDLYGELATALRARNMRLVAPFHIIRGYNWFLPGWNQWEQSWDEEAVSHGKSRGWDLYDPEYAGFYQHQLVGAGFERFLADWKAKVKEVIDAYRPDLMWFDGGRFSEAELQDHSLEVLSYYLNRSDQWGKQVCVLNKLPVSMTFNFHPEFGVWQFEEGRDRPASGAIPGVEPTVSVDDHLWNDDMRVGDKSWGWVRGQVYKSGRELIHGLIDRTARGGSLMLSLSPKSDGTIPEGQSTPLRELGDWLSTHREAIHGTRPFSVHAEGDESKLLEEPRRGHRKWTFTNCGPEDLRYTRSKDGKTVYAFSLGAPTSPVAFSALGKDAGNLAGRIESVTRLSDGRPAEYRWDGTALHVEVPPLVEGVEAEERVAAVWKVQVAG